MISAATLAQTAFALGACQAAAAYYGKALNRARAADQAEAIGSYAYDMAVCLIARGDLEQAGDLLEEATVELERAGVPLADVFLVQAQLAWHRGVGGDAQSLTHAVAAARRVLDDPRAQPTAAQRAQAALLFGEIACQQGDSAEVATQLMAARTLAGAEPTPGLRAGLDRVAGCLALSQGRSEAAGQHFDDEAGWLRQSRRYADMARALRRAGLAYRQAGLLKAATERYYRAARSWLGQGRINDAEQDVAVARTVAGQLRDTQLMPLVAGLARAIEAHKEAVSSLER
jgi:tetratricopeptide (TPR) repeat protein